MEDVSPEGFVPLSQRKILLGKDCDIESKQVSETAQTRTAALNSKCWSTAFSPLQQLLYIFFVSWLVGSNPSLFGIVMLATAIYMQLQSLINVQKSFLPFQEYSNTLPLNTCKFVFVLCNMIGNFVLYHRVKAFGLFDFFEGQSSYAIHGTNFASREEIIRVIWW
ncbi:hypothetical protein Gasu2_66850 [Galdieria sulphuraria]|uniref:ER membrane protein complex subunit 4 n=1 Tax=Galdieria sulphuraria TaxID=130081 RepID=M2XAE3_GALSU|nr:uncharacterized protein Gasu_55190 [Galdieria sulphuraria]EME26832.1 hypothetical protein Gasu_55190 [Galdieria sulphuraria]GJD12611.1 hypothetical protein Gasu2_66850 [Galdieria sulphuraria]|eukprot:XP_005703352.1 hypothetical protein Gasu_55190 [Galdieria sulphuraria]